MEDSRLPDPSLEKLREYKMSAVALLPIECDTVPKPDVHENNEQFAQIKCRRAKFQQLDGQYGLFPIYSSLY